jgi:hypothetical protein
MSGVPGRGQKIIEFLPQILEAHEASAALPQSAISTSLSAGELSSRDEHGESIEDRSGFLR